MLKFELLKDAGILIVGPKGPLMAEDLLRTLSIPISAKTES
jgi:hypothetical protein